MSDLNLANSLHDFEQFLHYIRKSHDQVYRQVNNALIDLYWQIGKMLSEKIDNEGWGKSTVSELAKYVARHAPDIKGFSDKNLWRMRQFYESYKGNQKLSSLVRELPWTHNTIIFSRCKSEKERLFYLTWCKAENYSKRELDRQISASLFERTLISGQKLSPLAREMKPGNKSVIKDSYVLEFLGLSDHHSENDLQKALVAHMKAFILELGKDFIFMGQEYRMQVGNQDFYLDLLFYHRGLQCLVAFELKTEKFKPDHIGQLNFYLEALDRDVKKENENPSIGVLLCKDKDDEVVEYALSRNLSPAMIAQYQLQLPEKKVLQAKLHELLEHQLPLEDE